MFLHIGLACKNNPTLFCKYIQRKFIMQTGRSSLLDGNTLVSSEKGKANLRNIYFSRVYAKENMSNVPVAYEAACSNGSTLSDVVITPKAVEEKLRMLYCNKSDGPNAIPARVLKELTEEPALCLSI